MSIYRIGVLSDTHIPKKSKELPADLVQAFQGVDLIIHAGDINRDYVIYELQELAPVEAVAGNTDDEFIWDMLGRKKVIPVGLCHIGVIHGDGTGGSTLDRVQRAFKGEKVQCVVFGHSHIPYCQKIDDVLYFNPGSPTDKRRQERFSYGILTVDGNQIDGEIKYIEG